MHRRLHNSRGFSLVEVMICAAVLAMVLLGTFSAVQLVDKLGLMNHESSSYREWHFVYAQKRAHSASASSLSAWAARGDWTTVDTVVPPDGAVLRERVVRSGTLPDTYILTSELAWEDAAKRNLSSTFSLAIFQP